MSNNLRQQIYDRMNLKETDELLEIWQANDRFEWSDEAFDVIKAILQKRGVETPEQGVPVYEHGDEEQDKSDHEFSKEELAIIDDENPPAFYNPFDVLLTTKRIDWMMKIMIAFIVLYNIVNFPNLANIVRGFFVLSSASPILEFILSILLAAINIVLSVIVMYVPLKVLTNILRILMEMEFQSRKAD